MPKLPVIRDKDLVKALRNLGFFEHRQKGSHLVMKHNDGRRVVVPLHPSHDIPKGTLAAIVRDNEINIEELIKNL